MKILNFGSCNIDYVYLLDHIVVPGETEMGDKLEIFSGGKGLNQSVATARAGASVYHAGCIGLDGDMLLDVMSKSGVDTSLIKRVDSKNGHAIIQVSAKGENSIFLYPGSNAMVTREYVDSVLEHFDRGDILLLQNEISEIEYIVERAYDVGMSIILNPSPINETIDKIDFNMLEHLILNEVEASAITGLDEPEKCIDCLCERYPRLKVMLTLGADGCVFSDGKVKHYHPTFKVKAVDTTAAGDTFTGYFAAELSRGKDIPTVLKIASMASAIAVSRMGAAPSIPEFTEVYERLEKGE